MSTSSQQQVSSQQPALSSQDDVVMTPTPLPESSRDKFFRKMKEQPLVPIGSLLTCGALIAASNHLRRGDRDQFQKALRWRVGLQGLTVAAAVVGSLYYNQKVNQAPPAPFYPQTTPSEASANAVPSQSARPVNKWQQMRAEERAHKSRTEFGERLATATERESMDMDKAIEEALLGKEEEIPAASKRQRPIVGQDSRRQV